MEYVCRYVYAAYIVACNMQATYSTFLLQSFHVFCFSLNYFGSFSTGLCNCLKVLNGVDTDTCIYQTQPA